LATNGLAGNRIAFFVPDIRRISDLLGCGPTAITARGVLHISDSSCVCGRPVAVPSIATVANLCARRRSAVAVPRKRLVADSCRVRCVAVRVSAKLLAANGLTSGLSDGGLGEQQYGAHGQDFLHGFSLLVGKAAGAIVFLAFTASN
jgi:hypothetical protein